jgi:hypothetical protein
MSRVNIDWNNRKLDDFFSMVGSNCWLIKQIRMGKIEEKIGLGWNLNVENVGNIEFCSTKY